jgi:hypothetical protein
VTVRPCRILRRRSSENHSIRFQNHQERNLFEYRRPFFRNVTYSVYKVSTKKRPDFIIQSAYKEMPRFWGYLNKYIIFFFHVISVSCLLQDFEFPPGLLGYLTSHDWVHEPVVNLKCVHFFKINLLMLCDWYSSVIRPHFYFSLIENTIKPEHFNADIVKFTVSDILAKIY